MKRFRQISFLLCVVLIFSAAGAAALEIVYPSDHSEVVRSDFLVIKAGTNPAIEALVIDINGTVSDPIDVSSPEYKAAFGDFLILEPTWDKGKNTVAVKGLVKGVMVSTVEAKLFYQADPGQITPAGYQAFVMHLPEKEQLCAPCHNMNPTKAQLGAADAAQNPCAACHKRILAKKNVHGPIGVFQCGDCHRNDAKPARPGQSRYAARLTGAPLCNECHAEQAAAYIKNKFVHGPVAIGMCESCHDPHASDYGAQLVAQVNVLCESCHVQVTKLPHAVSIIATGKKFLGHPLLGPKNPREPGKPFNCVSCHDPHGGAGPTFLVGGAVTAFGVCGKCHQK